MTRRRIRFLFFFWIPLSLFLVSLAFLIASPHPSHAAVLLCHAFANRYGLIYSHRLLDYALLCHVALLLCPPHFFLFLYQFITPMNFRFFSD
jgi:hypothetical protein